MMNPPSKILVVGLLLLSFGVVRSSNAHEGSHERIQRLTAAIAERPSEAALYADRAEAHRDDRSFGDALSDYERAFSLSPGNSELAAEFAQMLLEAGHPGQALDVVEVVLNREPDHKRGRRVHARAHAARGEWDQASQAFRSIVLETSRPSPDLILEWASALASSKNLEAALLALDEGGARLGELPILEERGVALEVELGRFESALSRVDRLLSRSPRKDRLLALRGEVLDAAGRPDEAVAAYREALETLTSLPARLRDVPASRALATRLRSRLEAGRE